MNRNKKIVACGCNRWHFLTRPVMLYDKVLVVKPCACAALVTHIWQPPVPVSK